MTVATRVYFEHSDPATLRASLAFFETTISLLRIDSTHGSSTSLVISSYTSKCLAPVFKSYGTDSSLSLS